MSIGNYIDLMSALFVGGAVISGVIVGRGVAYHTSTAIRDISIPYGVIGSLIGLVLMLSNLSDPSKIGPDLSVALLPILYGIILSGLAHIVVTCLEKVPPTNQAPKQIDFMIQIIALIILFIPIIAAMSFKIYMVINLPSMIIVLIGILGFSFAEQSVTDGESKLSALMKRISFYSICTTGAGILIMLVGLLKHLHDPKQMGPMIAIGFCTAIYAGLYFIGSVLIYRDLNKQTLPHVQMYTVSFLMLYFLNMALAFLTIIYSMTLKT
jgi:hypothetical protein